MDAVVMPLIVGSMLSALAFVALNQFTSRVSCLLALIGAFCPFLFITGFSSGVAWAANLGLWGATPLFVSSLVALSFTKKPPYALPSCLALFIASILGATVTFAFYLGIVQMP